MYLKTLANRFIKCNFFFFREKFLKVLNTSLPLLPQPYQIFFCISPLISYSMPLNILNQQNKKLTKQPTNQTTNQATNKQTKQSTKQATNQLTYQLIN
jgi:hypothetical protein